MGIVEWFKKTTFEGKIKRDLGSVIARKGVARVRLEVQELEPKGTARRFRLNFVATTPMSWQSLPVVLDEPEMLQLKAIVNAALEQASAPEPVRPTRW